MRPAGVQAANARLQDDLSSRASSHEHSLAALREEGRQAQARAEVLAQQLGSAEDAIKVGPGCRV